MGNAVSAKAADERAAQKRHTRRQKREIRRKRRLMRQRPQFDESGNPVHYNNQGNKFYYDSKGNACYMDETGTWFHIDDHGAPYYLNENDKPYYLDENKEKFYLDENREPYYLDKNGEKYFLDTNDTKYYFDKDGTPFLADEKSSGHKENEDLNSEKFKQRRMGVISEDTTDRMETASLNKREMAIRIPVPPPIAATTETKTGDPVTDELSIVSSKLTTPITADSKNREMESILSPYSTLSFVKSEFEEEIANTPDYIKDNTEESESRRTAQIQAEDKVLKRLLENEKKRKALPRAKSYRKVGSFNIKLKDDCKDCSVSGQAFLPNGNLIIADFGNRKLKLFDSELEVITSQVLDFSPQNICSGTTDNLVHVTFKTRMRNEIKIVRVEEKRIKDQQTVKTKGAPYGIARSHDGLAVMMSNPNGWQIHLMDLKCKLSRVIELEDNSLRLANPEYLIITKGLNLIVTDRGSNIVYCFDSKGNELFQYKQLREPIGICADTKGSVFITSPGVVHQLSASGERIKALMRRETIGFAPSGICFDPEDGLLVLTGQSNTMLAFELIDNNSS